MMKEVLVLLGQIVPVLLEWFAGDQKTRAEALDRFEGWVTQHKGDGNESADLRTNARDQADDLAARAAARDEALVHPAALPVKSPPAGSVTPSGPKSSSGVPLVPPTT